MPYRLAAGGVAVAVVPIVLSLWQAVLKLEHWPSLKEPVRVSQWSYTWVPGHPEQVVPRPGKGKIWRPGVMEESPERDNRCTASGDIPERRKDNMAGGPLV